jgi:hypothetical protein
MRRQPQTIEFVPRPTFGARLEGLFIASCRMCGLFGMSGIVMAVLMAMTGETLVTLTAWSFIGCAVSVIVAGIVGALREIWRGE